MKKNVYLSTLLITSIIALNFGNGVFAACSNTASQTITGALPKLKQVVANGGNITAVIAEAGGALSVAMNPGFRMTTNTNTSQSLYITAKCDTTGGIPVDALSGTGATGGTFICLSTAGTTGLPAIGDVGNAQALAPTSSLNKNVIAYSVDAPVDQAGILAYTWNAALNRWDGTLSKKGITDTLMNIPAGAPKPDTFSPVDEDGVYQATITLSFV